MTFWRRVVQREVAPLVQAEQQGSSPTGSGGGVAWSQYDFVGRVITSLSIRDENRVPWSSTAQFPASTC
ncbi:uncharacterized protein ACA1_352740 [Acanthamoeba castellanii str. Neff]|uniref:Uncharacterized protein n=1 Tax=Acanthamoeba castellanii (strain ATCC 30010 / Neff) TaxID=1257118 RepID=L8H7E3_ACACF|nr:uncharacterized protein ACA1_352740 [Acanthamoeba castellanii str. Neff]ELR20406.1 hypothetical protein ACA1_352740 [Acanthamoeba castellanii str. Neff]